MYVMFCVYWTLCRCILVWLPFTNFFFILLNTTYHVKMETEWSILRDNTQRQQNYIDSHERRTYNSHKNMPKSEKSKIKRKRKTWIKNKMKKKDRMVWQKIVKETSDATMSFLWILPQLLFAHSSIPHLSSAFNAWNFHILVVVFGYLFICVLYMM